VALLRVPEDPHEASESGDAFVFGDALVFGGEASVAEYGASLFAIVAEDAKAGLRGAVGRFQSR
jgi:hypothetical protein